MEVTCIRWLGKATVLRMIIITIGVSIVMKELALLAWGESVRKQQPGIVLAGFDGVDELVDERVAGEVEDAQVRLAVEHVLADRL